MTGEIIIRTATAEDADDIHALTLALIDDGRGMVLSRQDVKAEEDRKVKLASSLTRDFDGRMGRYLVAEQHGRVVGTGEVERIRLVRLMHNVRLSLGVHPAAQGQGIGRRLMKGLLTWARDVRPRVRRVELGVLANNERAIALYESLGFVREGYQQGFLWGADGSFVDNLQMVLRLDVTSSGHDPSIA